MIARVKRGLGPFHAKQDLGKLQSKGPFTTAIRTNHQKRTCQPLALYGVGEPLFLLLVSDYMRPAHRGLILRCAVLPEYRRMLTINLYNGAVAWSYDFDACFLAGKNPTPKQMAINTQKVMLSGRRKS